MDPKPKTHTFVLLDGLRGVAALAVVQHHFASRFGGSWFPHGYLAVDFFFLLSGFVLAHAYQARLDAGWSTWQFLRVRAIRLYPLYLLSALLAASRAVLAFTLGGGHIGQRSLAWAVPLSLVLLPLPSQIVSYPDLFPLNFPTWSLFYEAAMNGLHAIFLRKRSDRFLAAVIAVSGMLLFLGARQQRTLNIGPYTSEMGWAFCRIIFSYTLGMLLVRHRQKMRWHLHPLASIAILLGCLALPTPAEFFVPFELLCIFVLFPVLLLLSAKLGREGVWKAPLTMLGVASYPIYVFHMPLGTMLPARFQFDMHVPQAGFLTAVAAFCFALAVNSLYDEPIRASIRRRFA